MTVAVAGHWELSWNAPIKEVDLWELPLADFGVEDWWMWPRSGVRNNEPFVHLHERDDIRDILAEHKDKTWVFMEPANEYFKIEPQSLTDFQHPEDALYVFGSAHFNPVASSLPRRRDHVVSLPTASNRGVLWPHQVLVATLYHRMVN